MAEKLGPFWLGKLVLVTSQVFAFKEIVADLVALSLFDWVN